MDQRPVRSHMMSDRPVVQPIRRLPAVLCIKSLWGSEVNIKSLTNSTLLQHVTMNITPLPPAHAHAHMHTHTHTHTHTCDVKPALLSYSGCDVMALCQRC